MTGTTTTPDALADAFADVLRRWLSPAEFAEMQRRNATPEYGGPVCASHDFCDANEAMAEAFKALTGREPVGSWETHPDPVTGEQVADDPAEEAQATADSALWNAAWEIAGARHLITPGAVQHETNPGLEALKAKVQAMREAVQ